MGSQRVAKLPPTRTRVIHTAVVNYSPRSAAAGKQASHAGAVAAGPISRTSSFIQSLSSSSVQKGMASLIELANSVQVKKRQPEEVLTDLGVSPENDRPLAELTYNLTKRLREDLTTQARSTESALAVETALSRSIMDLVHKSAPLAKTESVTRKQLANAFKGVSSREVANLMMKNVISSLLARVLDAARGDIHPQKIAELTKKIDREFSPFLARKIDRLAREKGVLPSRIAASIPDWAQEIAVIVDKYKLS